MEDDFDLFSLEPFKPEEGHQGYTSPAPKNDFNKIKTGVNKASLTWRIAVPEDAAEDERKKASRGEKLLTGILDRNDRKLRKLGEPILREGLAWFGLSRGMLVLKCLIYKDNTDDTATDIRPWDPMHAAWEHGADSLLWAANIYHITAAEMQDRYNKKTEMDSDGKAQIGTIIDFFNRKINAVVLLTGTAPGDMSEFVKAPTEHGMDHVPVFIGYVGSMPTIYNRQDVPELKHRAASVWASSRNTYGPRDKQVSFVMDVAEKSVAGTLLFYSRDGKKILKGDPFASWQVINLVKGEDEIKELMPAPVPAASGAVLGMLDRDLQQSTIPFPIGYGLDPQAHSGTALAMMNDNTRSIYDPFSSLIETAYTWLCEEILTQFKSKGQKIKLQGFDKTGKFFTMDASPNDVQDDWYIDVKCEPKLPRDEAAELQMALASTNPRPNGKPLLSDYTAYEKILKLQDPDAEKIRIEEQLINDMIASNPSIQIRKVAKALVAKGDREGAMELLSTIPAPGGGPGGTPPQTPTGGPPMSQGMPPQAPAGPGGPPPQIQMILEQVAQALNLPVEQVANIPPEQVKMMLQQKAQGGM